MNTILGFKREYGWLSNFATLEYPIIVNGCEFNTTENLYQAFKCVNSDDFNYISRFSPSSAKKIGRSVKINPYFEENKLEIMYGINKLKYEQPYFKNKLLSTGDSLIVEDNNWNDVYWGQCNCIGENHLGKIIIRIRDELKKTFNCIH